MRGIAFTPNGWVDYQYWVSQNKTILKKINQLIGDCQGDPFKGLGKPEPLKHYYTGTWSRRITDEHRLVYLVKEDCIVVISCRYHYEK